MEATPSYYGISVAISVSIVKIILKLYPFYMRSLPMNKLKLDILYEDTDIIVCKKPAGIATQSKQLRTPDLESLIKRHLYSTAPSKGEPYLAVIHRLDQPVSGILVFAKTPLAAKSLNAQLQRKGFGKHYKAVLTAPPQKTRGKLIDYMKKNSQTNHSSICDEKDPNGKKAILDYEIIETPTQSDWDLFKHCHIHNQDSLSLVHITLDTGRHHQIRLQMAHLGCPILGDTKYGSDGFTQNDWQHIALCAYRLEFTHPSTNKLFSFELNL